jgi:hypothetical protein
MGCLFLLVAQEFASLGKIGPWQFPHGNSDSFGGTFEDIHDYLGYSFRCFTFLFNCAAFSHIDLYNWHNYLLLIVFLSLFGARKNIPAGQR